MPSSTPRRFTPARQYHDPGRNQTARPSRIIDRGEAETREVAGRRCAVRGWRSQNRPRTARSLRFSGRTAAGRRWLMIPNGRRLTVPARDDLVALCSVDDDRKNPMIETRKIETAPGLVFDVSAGGPESAPLVLMLHGFCVSRHF